MVVHVLFSVPAPSERLAVLPHIRASAFGPRDPRKPASLSRVSPFTWFAGRQRFPGHKAQPVDACKHASPKVSAMKAATTDDGKSLLTDLSDCVHGT